jgi:hypothetical protein
VSKAACTLISFQPTLGYLNVEPYERLRNPPLLITLLQIECSPKSFSCLLSLAIPLLAPLPITNPSIWKEVVPVEVTKTVADQKNEGAKQAAGLHKTTTRDDLSVKKKVKKNEKGMTSRTRLTMVVKRYDTSPLIQL